MPLEYASIVPSGDHAGPSSCAVLFVIMVAFVPSAFMTQISASLPGLTPKTSRLDWNAIRVPSGDQAGAESKAPGKSNSVVTGPPVTACVSIARSVSPVGDLTLANRKRVPSGEMLG